MTAQSPKPREAYLHRANDNYYTEEQFAEQLKRDARIATSYIHFREVLSEANKITKDEVRVSRVLTEDLNMILSHVNTERMSAADESIYWLLRERSEREQVGK